MISPDSSPDEEVLNAYEIIKFNADETWSYKPGNPYRKSNQSLWVKICKINQRYLEDENRKNRRVQDVIPGSRLAMYGNYEYDEEQEKKYKPMENFRVEEQNSFEDNQISEPWMFPEVEDHFTRLSQQICHVLFNNQAQEKEDDSVKRKNTTLSTVKNYEERNFPESRNKATGESSRSAASHDGEYRKFAALRYTIENLDELELQSRVTSELVHNLWNQVPLPEIFLFPSQQIQPYFLSHQMLPVILHLIPKPQKLPNGQEYSPQIWSNQTPYVKVGHYYPPIPTIGVMRSPPVPFVNPEVPEYYPHRFVTPVVECDERGAPLQVFPSTSSEIYYPEDLFSQTSRQTPNPAPNFQNTNVSILPHHVNAAIQYPEQYPQWYQRVAIPLQLQGPIYVPQHPIYAAIQPIYPAVVQQPIALSEKTLSSGPTAAATAAIPVYQKAPESYPDYPQRRKNQGADFNNLILLTKGGIKTRRPQTKGTKQKCHAAKEKSNSDIIHSGADKIDGEDDIDSELSCSESKCICLKMKNSKQINSYKNGQFVELRENTIEIGQKKRLYSDVLANSPSSRVEENSFEKTYDNLERQAIEQYRTSEECLALRYQELERQALEQYMSSENSGSEDFLNIDFVQPENSQRGDDQSLLSLSKNSFGAACSDYAGNCSRIETSTVKETGFHSEAIAKSLTTLSRNIKQEQRDTSKGASGDENDNEARGPSKQILLMTSLTRSSYINVIKTTDIKTLCKNFVPIFYQVPIMMQAGGGDEQIAFDCSPYTMGKCLIHSEEHFINGSLNPIDQKSTISSHYEGTSFSELNYVTRPQDKLPFPCSEVQLISGQNIIEEEYLRTESYFTLQIEQYLKDFMKHSYTEKIKVVDNFDEYLKNVIWSNFVNKSKITEPIINDSNRDNSRLDEAVLQPWDEVKRTDTNLAIEVNNVVEKNRSYETMTGNHCESVPELLKKAYGILRKLQSDKANHEFELRTRMFHDTETILENFLQD